MAPDMASMKSALEAGARPSPDARPRSAQATREVRRDSALRQARTCYDHLAGVAGVRLLDELLNRGWLEEGECHEAARSSYQLTPDGTKALNLRGVELELAPKSRRPFAFGCLDWTERRDHLAGTLGAAIFSALVSSSVVRRQHGTRAVALQVKLPGGVREWLDRRA